MKQYVPVCAACGNRTYLEGPDLDRPTQIGDKFFHRGCLPTKQVPLMDRCSHCGAVLNGDKNCPNQSRKGHLPPERVQ